MVRFFLPALIFCVTLDLFTPVAEAAGRDQLYRQGVRLEKQGAHFDAARYFFQAVESGATAGQQSLAFANIARNLAAVGMYQSASYFALRVLEIRYAKGTQRVLPVIARIIPYVGSELFSKYLTKYTNIRQYAKGVDQFLYYALAKQAMEANRPKQALLNANKIDASFIYYPQSLYIRGAAALILGQTKEGIQYFEACANIAESSTYREFTDREEQRDLKNRCLASIARGFYQAKQYEDAEEWYNKVEIKSMAWPQVQYERAWNAVARGDYNRALGRLVTYKAPALQWYLNSEVNTLRALSYYQLCIYDEVEKESNDFVRNFTSLGNQLRGVLARSNVVDFYNIGAKAYNDGLYTMNPFHKILNRFIRTPRFLESARMVDRAREEEQRLESLGAAASKGLGAFLRQVLAWRVNTAVTQGGLFVRDRLSAEYKSMLANIQTMDILKLEMLRKARLRIEKDGVNDGEDVWGRKKRGSLPRPPLKDNQQFWEFNGEFWNDELGEYVFALQSECR